MPFDAGPKKPPLVLKVEELCELSIDMLDLLGTVLLENASEEQKATFEMYQIDWEKRLGAKRADTTEVAE